MLFFGGGIFLLSLVLANANFWSDGLKETMPDEKDTAPLPLSLFPRQSASTSTVQEDFECIAVKIVICQNSFECQSRQVYLVKYFVLRAQTELTWIFKKYQWRIQFSLFDFKRLV